MLVSGTNRKYISSFRSMFRWLRTENKNEKIWYKRIRISYFSNRDEY